MDELIGRACGDAVPFAVSRQVGERREMTVDEKVEAVRRRARNKRANRYIGGVGKLEWVK